MNQHQKETLLEAMAQLAAEVESVKYSIANHDGSKAHDIELGAKIDMMVACANVIEQAHSLHVGSKVVLETAERAKYPRAKTLSESRRRP